MSVAPPFELAIDEEWLDKNRRTRRTLYGMVAFYAVALATAIALGVGSSARYLPFSAIGIVVLVVLALLTVRAYGAQFARASRFMNSTRHVVHATDRGIVGDVFPTGSFTRSRAEWDCQFALPESLVVVRSPVFGREVEVAEEPNFVPWNRITFIIDTIGNDLGVGFWTRDIRRENWILHDLVLRPNSNDLGRLVGLATRGGADVHAGPQVLTAEGARSSTRCESHAAAEVRQIPIRASVRLPVPESKAQADSWFVTSST